MPRTDPDDAPKCLLCGERGDGQRYRFWAGTHTGTTHKRAFLSSTTTVTSKFRDMKRVGAFACRGCARRTVARASLPTVVGFGLVAAVCGAVAAWGWDRSPLLGPVFAGLAGLAGLVSLAWLAMSLAPNLDSRTSEGIIRDKVAPALRRQGKGDSFFTDREYEVLFTTKPADRAETAAELLGGVDDDEDEPPRRVRGGGDAGSAAALTRCPNCAKATPARPAAKACKWCQTPLP